jgi:hypothetical protein
MTDDIKKRKIIELAERAPERKPPELTAPSDGEVVERLVTLSVLDYEKVREAEAKALGVRVSVLDGLVAARRRENERQARGSFTEALEPWPDPATERCCWRP